MKNYDFQENFFKFLILLKVILNALLPAIFGMVDVFLDLWKYLKGMTIKIFIDFVD